MSVLYSTAAAPKHHGVGHGQCSADECVGCVGDPPLTPAQVHRCEGVAVMRESGQALEREAVAAGEVERLESRALANEEEQRCI